MCAHLIRLWATLHGWPVDLWCQENHACWGQSVAGSAPLQAALLRLATSECQVALGRQVGTAVLDVKGLYDHLLLGRLWKHGMAYNFPKEVLGMSLQMDMAPRTLVSGLWCCPEPIWPGRSIATGERNGNHKSRLGTYVVIQAIHDAAMGATIRQWVDDIPVTAAGHPDYLTKAITAAVTTARVCMAREGLILSAKTGIDATQDEVAERIVKEVCGRGTAVRRVKGIAFLGVSAGQGKGHVVTRRVARRRQAARKVRRVLSIFSVRHKASLNVYRSSIAAQAGYDDPVYGLTEAEIKQRRAVWGATLDGGRKGRCLTSLAAIKGVLAMDPEVEAARRQLAMWLQL